MRGFAIKGLVAAIMAVQSVPSARAAEAQKVEDYFPPQVKVEVPKKPLNEQERSYLKKFGVDDRTLNIFGGVFAKGYSNNKRWGDVRPDDLGDMKITYDTTGMVKLAPLPPAGVHPRMLFTDADRPSHRNRLEKTKGGHEAWKVMMAYSQLLKGKYDAQAGYAQPDTFKGNMGTHGFLPIFRAGSNNETNAKIWDAYTSGRLPEGLPANYNQLNPGLCAVEAFRCWVYEDAEGARKVGKAMETAIRAELGKLKPGQLPGDNEAAAVKRYFNYNLTYVYDFIYNYLTPEQRDLFRETIVASNFNSDQYGVFQNAFSTSSNWATFSYRLHGWLGIEGDPGYNYLQYLGYRRGMQNYFTYGWFKAGCCFEAFGKNQIGGEIVYPMALRGDFLAAHPHILATVRDYLPHAILPWGNAYVAYDRWGSPEKPLNSNDVLPFKALFPNDKRIDWVYRNTVHPDYSWMQGDVFRVEGYSNNSLLAIIWAQDYDPKNDDPGKLMDSESFVDPQRGLVITRSDWSKDALYMQHHVRGQSGGHVFADRSSFMLGGRGRMWVPNPAIGYETRQNSVVMVDGLQFANRAPSRLADYKRTELATFSTADLRDTANYDYNRLYVVDGKIGHISLEDARTGNYEMAPGWEPENKSFNDYALVKDTRSAVFSMPRFQKPDWITPGEAETAIRKKRTDIEVSTAFRTIGMVRPTAGAKGEPYVLAIDDWSTTDGRAHNYDWQMRIAPDLMVIDQQTYAVDQEGKTTRKPAKGAPILHDIVLAPKDAISLDGNQRRVVAQGSPALLVRVLQMEGEAPETGAVMLGFADESTQKLVIRTQSKSPAFKILVFPYLNRQTPMPVTAWDKARQSLTIKIGNQVDHFAFKTLNDGRTIFELTREAPGKETLRYAGHEFAAQ